MNANRWPLLLMMLACILTPGLRADEAANAAKLLGQTREQGALPLFAKPPVDSRTALGQAARRMERAVFLVGHPDTGTGTAWAISKKHRLLVTNAHVADMFHMTNGKMLAIPSGTSQIHIVERVWYHPGVRRYLKGNQTLSIRSIDPGEGEVDPSSPDLAVLELDPEGPELEVEFPIAEPDEWNELFGQPTAMYGFPGHDTASWPKLGGKAAATFHDGMISRVTDFDLNVDAPAGELQFLQYTMSTWPGFSGSPVFLPSGRVAAVNNMARIVRTGPKEGEMRQSIPYGVRIDCVLELIVHHKLEEKVPFAIDKSKLSIERWLARDERSEKARADFARAEALVQEARKLVFVTNDFAAGETKANQAIELAPNLASAYYVKGMALMRFQVYNHDRLSTEASFELLESSRRLFLHAGQLNPAELYYARAVCAVLNNFGRVTGDTMHNEKALNVLNQLLTADNLTPSLRALILNSRGVAFNHLGDNQAALRDHNEAVRLYPIPSILDDRASFHEVTGNSALARADRARAQMLRQK